MTFNPSKVAAVLVLLIVAKMALNLFSSPADAVRAELAAELASIPDRAPLSGTDDRDFAALCNPVLEKPSLWQHVIAAPPTPPAPEVKPMVAAPPNAPNLETLLNGLILRPGQIGQDKMKVITPANPEGAWMALGDTFNGCVLESFTREEAVFSYFWEDGNDVIRATLPRPLR